MRVYAWQRMNQRWTRCCQRKQETSKGDDEVVEDVLENETEREEIKKHT